MLAENPSTHPVIMLKEAKAEEIEGILRFIYTGEVRTSPRHPPAFAVDSKLELKIVQAIEELIL